MSRIGAAAGAAMVVAALVGGCGQGKARSDCDAFKVDSVLWRQPASGEASPASGQLSARQKMADRIVACHTLNGKPGNKVRKLLGTPYRGQEGWYYDLGQQRDPGGLDNEQLFVQFDGHGRVKHTEVVTF